MLDIGLLQRLCGMDAHAELAEDDLLAMYRGKLAEQFVAQKMLTWHNRELYYWARNAKSSNAEIDYLTVRDPRIAGQIEKFWELARLLPRQTQ